jgi:hypothetical protein
MLPARAIALAALLGSTPLSPAYADFESLRGQATRLDSLGPFLERYVGSCKDDFNRADCEHNVREARRGLDRAIYATSIAERTLEIIRPERTRTGYRFVITPFIDGGGLALTNGVPRQDGAGRPLIGFLVLEGPLPAGMDELALESAIRTGRVELEVIFRPQGTWKLKRMGEAGHYEGVKARFLGLRLVESRSGAAIASKVY